ncbi:MAG: four helix bundle protein [Phycisphaerales bacterium]|jgi:four helix bundle protein|nr:four helix bundle protein [Phycisphaerales bacterium]
MGEAGAIKSFRDLIAWRLAYDLGLNLIPRLSSFPGDERFGLALQIRRSAVSVPSNIAEGFGRGSRSDYVRFLFIARGSLYELSTQMGFAFDLGYLPASCRAEMETRLDECERVLWGLIRSLQSKPAEGD